MQTEVGLISENAVRRAGLVDVLMRGGFDVRAFGEPTLVRHERLVQGAAAIVVDLEMTQVPPSRILDEVMAAAPDLPRFVIGSPLHLAALLPGQAVHLATGDERPEELALTLRRALQQLPSPIVIPFPEKQRSLTPRQRDVMDWLAVGADNLKIAAVLNIGERAVKAHITRLLQHFQVENRTELALVAWRAGFRPPDQ